MYQIVPLVYHKNTLLDYCLGMLYEQSYYDKLIQFICLGIACNVYTLQVFLSQD